MASAQIGPFYGHPFDEISNVGWFHFWRLRYSRLQIYAVGEGLQSKSPSLAVNKLVRMHSYYGSHVYLIILFCSLGHLENVKVWSRLIDNNLASQIPNKTPRNTAWPNPGSELANAQAVK